MTRKPTDAPPKIMWHAIGEDFPRLKRVLTTTKPQTDPDGVPAVWYERRRSIAGRWVHFADWVDPMTRGSLDPQPTHWRADPMTGKFTEASEMAEAS